jgi:predicted DNA-binding transcriptional regulator YafY
MQKSERLFRLVLLLRRGRVTTARELADTLEVSERTIYRDVQSLTLSGIPVEGEAGVGYILRHKLDLPPLMFSSEEAIALALGARMVMAWGDSDLEKAAVRVLEKVDAVAPPEVKTNLQDTAIEVPNFHINPTTKATLGKVRKALTERRKLRLHYVRVDGTESRRTVRPLGLFYWGSTWALGAWCEMRQGFRNFRIDRISEVRALNRSFEIDASVSLEEYMRTVAR